MREELLAQARRHLWAAWLLSSDEIGSVAAESLFELGMLVPEGGAQELEKLRERVAELEAEKKRAAAHAERLATTLVARTEDLMAAEADGITRRIVPTQALQLEDPHDSPLHHSYRVGRDLPETGGPS